MSLQDTPEYRALRAIGHSAFKAAEIALDAQRGEEYALLWVKLALQRAGVSS